MTNVSKLKIATSSRNLRQILTKLKLKLRELKFTRPKQNPFILKRLITKGRIRGLSVLALNG